MYNEIKEKGVFWGFDQLIEKGYVSYAYEENEIRMSKGDLPVNFPGSNLRSRPPPDGGSVMGKLLEFKNIQRTWSWNGSGEEDEREEEKNSVIENSQDDDVKKMFLEYKARKCIEYQW
ncbi:hypothetical protein L1887_19157 [Cichorium endivia]|nr:hypothetical protein L1887_19157 [Cichorium endivia]